MCGAFLFIVALSSKSGGFLSDFPGCPSPGRFFAANEMKAMMAHIVITYDLKLEDEGVRPKDEWYGSTCLPNRKAEVFFRRRQT